MSIEATRSPSSVGSPTRESTLTFRRRKLASFPGPGRHGTKAALIDAANLACGDYTAAVVSTRPSCGGGLALLTCTGLEVSPDLRALDYYGHLRRYEDTLEGRASARFRFHDLRHSAASLLIAEGVELVEESMLLGHSELRVTADLYTHLVKRTAAKAARRVDAVFAPAK